MNHLADFMDERLLEKHRQSLGPLSGPWAPTANEELDLLRRDMLALGSKHNELCERLVETLTVLEKMAQKVDELTASGK